MAWMVYLECTTSSLAKSAFASSVLYLSLVWGISVIQLGLGFRVVRTAKRQEALSPPKYGAQYNLRQHSLSESPIKFQVYLKEKLRSQT